jgi:hypothetical protein
MVNEFFVTREGKSHQGNENIHFATNLKRTLTIPEAVRFYHVLGGLLAAEVAPVASKPAHKSEVSDSGPKPFGA